MLISISALKAKQNQRSITGYIYILILIIGMETHTHTHTHAHTHTPVFFFITWFCTLLVKNVHIWKLQKYDNECCHFGPRSLHQCSYKPGWHAQQKQLFSALNWLRINQHGCTMRSSDLTHKKALCVNTHINNHINKNASDSNYLHFCCCCCFQAICIFSWVMQGNTTVRNKTHFTDIVLISLMPKLFTRAPYALEMERTH